MFSFLILILVSLIQTVYYLIDDIKNNNYKYIWRRVVVIILSMIALYLKSINL